MLLSVALQEAALRSAQPLPAVFQAAQGLDRLVAPHDVQLQHRVVIHRAEQCGAALTAQDIEDNEQYVTMTRATITSVLQRNLKAHTPVA